MERGSSSDAQDTLTRKIRLKPGSTGHGAFSLLVLTSTGACTQWTPWSVSHRASSGPSNLPVSSAGTSLLFPGPRAPELSILRDPAPLVKGAEFHWKGLYSGAFLTSRVGKGAPPRTARRGRDSGVMGAHACLRGPSSWRGRSCAWLLPTREAAAFQTELLPPVTSSYRRHC